MSRRAWLALPAALLAVGCHASPAPAPRTASTILPLRTVRFYETGVGYFERSGSVDPGQGTSVPVPAAHIDDALKTLVVTGPGGIVHGLEFSSSVSSGMARALGGLPLGSEGPIQYKDVLAGLKGSAVEVRTERESVAGRLVDVIEKSPAADDSDDKKAKPAETPPPALELLVLSDRAEVRTFRSSQVVSVRPTDPVVAARWSIALDTLSARSAQTQRLLRVMSGSANVTIGYVAETPVWRTTYRMVMADDGKTGVLQGWALLHNDTDESWSQVRVHLVNGRPESFLYPLAAPRYTQRELQTPEDQLSTVPQLYDKSPDAIWGDNVEARDAWGSSAGISAGYGTGGGGGYLGSSHRTRAPTVRMGATSSTTSESHLLSIGTLAPIPQATGVESGALFTYTLPELVDLRAHGSALVPFTSQTVQARRLTWVDGGSPQTAILFTNTTRQTLPAGPLAGYSGGGFTGEATLERTKPGERRLLRLGDDLDLELSQSIRRSEPDYRRATFDGDRLLQTHYVDVTTHTLELENRGGQERVVCIPVRTGRNARLTGADELDFEPGSERPVAMFRVPARTRLSRQMVVELAAMRSEAGDSLASSQLEKVVASSRLEDADRKVLIEAIAKVKEVEAAGEERSKVEQEEAEVQGDLERFREHLKAASGDKGGPGGVNPFAQRIIAAEDKLSALRKRKQAIEAEQTQRRQLVRATLRKLGK